MAACTPLAPDRAHADQTRRRLASRTAPPRRPNLNFPRPAAKVTLDLTELLRLSIADTRDLGVGLGLGKARPGPAWLIFRKRFAIPPVAQIVRWLAGIGGVTRLAVRTRTGQAVSELGCGLPVAQLGPGRGVGVRACASTGQRRCRTEAVVAMINTEGAGLAAAPLGSAPRLIRPRIPVVAITGTNGKTTTARLSDTPRAELAGQWAGRAQTGCA
jgi:cyanophycin synthetase